ncbi:longitudinals lacking protein, isoforms N/O/W/X/Y-like [Ischnura elegans]|uniref:longitudinals lacking protein, isoforms N/O/W/X/Y-like n=1 Tax=Ischnura elegans TaxID=197161 RepID=UPI001ED88FCF|nr:longitudinals lacking protein, isoforms N/O/W/X/Y-like [Ischnura elegans]
MSLKGPWRRQDWSSALRDANVTMSLPDEGVEGGGMGEEFGADDVEEEEEPDWVDEEGDEAEEVDEEVGVFGGVVGGVLGEETSVVEPRDEVLPGRRKPTVPATRSRQRKSRAKGDAGTSVASALAWIPPRGIDGLYSCEQCGRTYKRKDSLRRHLQWECGKEPQFQCPFCPQRSKRKAHQIRHIRRLHKDTLLL